MTVFFFKHKTAYEMRISDWSSDVCSSDLKSVVAAEESRPDEALPVAAAAAPDTDSPAEVEDPNADLPPIESLDKDSDYTAFLRAGVAPELRKQALGKLWRSDPSADRKSTRLNSSH